MMEVGGLLKNFITEFHTV